MRILITAAIMLLASGAIFAQNKSQLKSETIELNRTKTSEKNELKIAVNENRCYLEQLIISINEGNEIEMRFDFERPCGKEKRVSLTFPNMQEALLVKDIVLNNNDHELFNLIVDKNEKTKYELRYKK